MMRTYGYDPQLKERYRPRPRRQPSKERVLAFIRKEIAAGREFPKVTQIAAYMGWKQESSAHNCLCGLVTLGHVTLDIGPYGRRHWELVP